MIFINTNPENDQSKYRTALAIAHVNYHTSQRIQIKANLSLNTSVFFKTEQFRKQLKIDAAARTLSSRDKCTRKRHDIILRLIYFEMWAYAFLAIQKKFATRFTYL